MVVDVGEEQPLTVVGCPVELIGEQGYQWRRQFTWLRRGDVGFWYPGPADSQPSKYLRAMESLSGYIAAIEAAEERARQDHLNG